MERKRQVWGETLCGQVRLFSYLCIMSVATSRKHRLMAPSTVRSHDCPFLPTNLRPCQTSGRAVQPGLPLLLLHTKWQGQ